MGWLAASTPLMVVAISGSPRSPSRSKTLAELSIQAFERKDRCQTQLIDLASLPSDALLGRGKSDEVESAISWARMSQVLVVTTPTYRALYTGLLKAFFDLMPAGHLRGKLCLGIQTGASPTHALAVDYGLGMLFRSLDGIPLASLYASDAEFNDGDPSDDLLARVDVIVGGAIAATGRRLIRKGQRFKAVRDFPVSLMITYSAPFSSDADAIFPAGEILVVGMDPPEGASAAACDPENYSELESRLVPREDLANGKYGGYGLVIPISDIFAHCQFVDEG